MPKAPLVAEEAVLERELIATMRAGLAEWRPDLDYPASYSDMESLARAVMRMFKVERLPLPRQLRTPCVSCRGTGYEKIDFAAHTTCECAVCNGRKWVPL